MINYSQFPNLYTPQGEQHCIDWLELVKRLQTFEVWNTKDQGRLYSPAVYKDDQVKRADANVVGMSFIVIDIDNSVGKGNDAHCSDDPTYPEDHESNLDGLTYCWHTTYSNTKDWPRGRIIIPTNRIMTRNEYRHVFNYAIGLLGHDKNIDSTCGELARAYYFPSYAPGKENTIGAGFKEGLPLDVDEIISDVNCDDLSYLPKTSAKVVSLSTLQTGQPTGQKYEGRNDALKAQVAACLSQGKTVDQTVEEIINYDAKHHNPPLFADKTENMRSDPWTNALTFVTNNIKSINQRRITQGQEAQTSLQPEIKETLPIKWFADIEPNLNAQDFIEDTLTEGGLSVIYGDSNTGKTFFAFDMACHIALGKKWHDKDVTQGAVVYVAAEGGHGIYNRVAAWRKYYGIKERLPLGIVNYPINLLDSQADVQKLINTISEVVDNMGETVRLVVIDTLARAMAGGNENSSEDMGALVMNADQVRNATGSHVCFIHHSGKDQAKGARGHSSLRAATDTEIEISRVMGMPAKVKITKQRDLEIVEVPEFSLVSVHLGQNHRGKHVSSCVLGQPVVNSMLTTKEKEALFCLINEQKRNKGSLFRLEIVRVKDVFAAAGVTDRNKKDAARAIQSRLLQALESKGYIEMDKDYITITKQPKQGETL